MFQHYLKTKIFLDVFTILPLKISNVAKIRELKICFLHQILQITDIQDKLPNWYKMSSL